MRTSTLAWLRSMALLRRWAVDVALFAIVVVLTAPILQPLGYQQASRMALTAAVWEQGTIAVDGYLVGDDRAEHDGRTYSDKAPGQPFFAIPFYALHQAVGGRSYADPGVDRNMALWWASLWSSSIPAGVLAVMLRRSIRRRDAAVATPVALAVMLGTLLLPFASLLFGHVLSTTLAFAAWSLATGGPLDRRRALVVGLLLSAAVSVEYTLGVAAIAVGYLVARDGMSRLVDLMLGGLPITLAVGIYHWAAFGAPWRISYSRSTFMSSEAAQGLDEIELPLFESAARVLLGERGLFLVTPVVAAAAAGTVVLAGRLNGRDRRVVLSGAAIAACLVAVQVAWSNPTGGDSPGARYATAAGAFLAPGLALAWRRWRTISLATALIGGSMMLAATWTNPLTARDTRGALRLWFEDLVNGRVADSIYAAGMGQFGWIPGVLLPAGAAVCVWAAHRQETSAMRTGTGSGGPAPGTTPRRAARASGP